MKRVLRPASIAVFVLALTALAVAPATAEMTVNPTPCRATATITDRSGTVVSRPDQDSAEIKIPNQGRVTWQANVGKKAKSYSGEIVLDLELFTYTPSAWRFKGGPQRDLKNYGVTDIPSVIRYLPPGKYKVAGFRDGDGERCEGHATLVLEGTPFTNPTGIGILAATVIAFIAFVRTSTARIP